jgi:hypothetical protein
MKLSIGARKESESDKEDAVGQLAGDTGNMV